MYGEMEGCKGKEIEREKGADQRMSLSHENAAAP